MIDATKLPVDNWVRNLRSRSLRIVVSLLALLMLDGGLIRAQTGVGRIVGKITDSSNAVIAGAKVVVRNTNTQVESETTTTDSGDYRFPSLPVGSYIVCISHPGFQTSERGDLRVVLGQSLTLDISLQ